tara:strand:- start:5800 stop:6387 length:588 start_codon:yes stop_codon:yes gene_type:complete
MKNYCFIIFLIPSLLFGQNEDLLQRINAFKTDHSIDYKIKSFNIGGERLGSIEYEESDFETRFKLEGRNKTKDNLDRNVRFDIYINIYEFVDQEELNWVMKRWLKNFIDGNQIRPGRDTRTVPHANPSIIIIEKERVSILNQPCTQFEPISFREWRSKMLTYFGSPSSIIIEIGGCEGPLNWTKNAPDPRDRTWK